MKDRDHFVLWASRTFYGDLHRDLCIGGRLREVVDRRIKEKEGKDLQKWKLEQV